MLASVWLDAIALAALLSAAVIIDRDFLTSGNYLPLPWGDWMAHAYRTRFVQEHGIATWDHNWSGGLAPFQNYQFLPHVFTGWLADLFDADIGRTMLAIEGVLLVWIRVSGYVTARALGLRPASALVAGVVTFGMNDYASEILSYTSLWGLAVVPLFLIVAYRWGERPAVYVLAAFAGFGTFFHPLLALTGIAILVAAFLMHPITPVRLSRLCAQALLVAMACSLFWLPALLSAKPPMQDPASADPEFLRAILDGGVERFSDVLWLYVPAVSLLLVLVWRRIDVMPLRFTSVFGLIVMFLIAVSYAGVGPEVGRLMQSVRLYTVIPMGVGILGAIALDGWLETPSRDSMSRFARSAVAVLAALALAVPLVRFAADEPYRPASSDSSQIDVWLSANEGTIDGRVWFDDLETAWYTYRHFDDVHASMSHYPVGDWSLLARPQQEGILVGEPGVGITEDYLKALSVSHVALSPSMPFALRLAAEGSPSGPYVEVARDDAANVVLYRTPWTPVEAFYTDLVTLPDIDVPRVKYKGDNERAERDRLVGAYVDLAYSEQARPVAIEYPSATTLRVQLRDLPRGQFLVLSENWDSAWKAQTDDGRELDVERYGPSYIGVDISQLSGDLVIKLHHDVPSGWTMGILLSVLALPLAGSFALFEKRRLRNVV